MKFHIHSGPSDERKTPDGSGFDLKRGGSGRGTSPHGCREIARTGLGLGGSGFAAPETEPHSDMLAPETTTMAPPPGASVARTDQP